MERPRWLCLVTVTLAIGSMSGADFGTPAPLYALEPGWSLNAIGEMPEPISALATVPDKTRNVSGAIFIGTSPSGGVYKLNPLSPASALIPVATGMGDQVRFGTCHVSRIDVRDLDHDGNYELLATTSQIFPPGRPRLYAWSLNGGTSVLLGVARPNIRSQWSHGLSFAEGPSGTGRAFATFCGNGEIVEYRMARNTSESGFSSEGLAWKQVGQLPASGEWTQSADVDNDGQEEVCFATGYAPGAAAIRIYSPGPAGRELVLKHEIDEGKRFGNVRFIVGDLGSDGTQDLMAWWCTDHLYGGDCEVIHYQLGDKGVASRRVVGSLPATCSWPDDGQFAVADLEGDGQREVWFASKGGDLWCYDGTSQGALRRVLHFDDGLGPIATGRVVNAPRPTLFLSSGRTVFRLDRNGADASVVASGSP